MQNGLGRSKHTDRMHLFSFLEQWDLQKSPKEILGGMAVTERISPGKLLEGRMSDGVRVCNSADHSDQEARSRHTVGMERTAAVTGRLHPFA